jgi:hypothetical protein
MLPGDTIRVMGAGAGGLPLPDDLTYLLTRIDQP